MRHEESLALWGDCWWFRNPDNQLRWSISHYLQGFIHVRWLFGISEPSTGWKSSCFFCYSRLSVGNSYVNPFWLGFLCMGITRSHRCTDRENCQWSFFKMIIWSWDGLSISNRIHVWYVYLHQPNVGKYTTHGCYGYGFAKTLPWLPPPHRYSTLCWYCLLSLPSIHQVYSSGTYQL